MPIRLVSALLWVLIMSTSPASEESPSKYLTLWRGSENNAFGSREFTVEPFDRAVLSWNSSGPGTTRFELEVDGEKYLMGTWSDKPGGAKSERVDVDTLKLKKPATSFRFHFVSDSEATVSLVAVTHWMDADNGTYSEKKSPAWGKILDVTPRAQGIEKKDPGKICSPTSLSTVLDFHGFKKTTREVAAGVFDNTSKIYGNWALNTAFAHRVSAMESYVVRASGLEELEAEIAAGRPVITSHRWNAGDLSNASISKTAGHLITVVGFTESGDVVVNDPAAKAPEVRRTYKRREFFKTWLENASGIMYVVKGK